MKVTSRGIFEGCEFCIASGELRWSRASARNSDRWSKYLGTRLAYSSLWRCRLTAPIEKIAERAARQNLFVWPLSTSYLSDTTRPGFVLGFGNTAAKDIPNAVRKLRKLLISG